MMRVSCLNNFSFVPSITLCPFPADSGIALRFTIYDLLWGLHCLLLRLYKGCVDNSGVQFMCITQDFDEIHVLELLRMLEPHAMLIRRA